jgi:two-component system phosphate regulon sensor histidine kinase PhoR
LKNPSPFKIALITSIVLGVIFAVPLYLANNNALTTIIWSLGFIPFTFITIRFILNYFIYDKIKLLYNSIQKQKTQKLDSGAVFTKLDENPIDTIDEEVRNWAESHNEEMAQLKQLAEYRREFLGNVSHELKTPITNIQGYIHTLLDGAMYDQSVNEKFLLKAAKSTDRLEFLVEELLNISRLEQGSLSLKLGEFDVVESCNTIIDSLESKAEKASITLNLDADSKKPIVVSGDKNLIDQVLTNLIVNGIKYGKKGGSVNISFQSLNDQIIVEISDDGIGIKEDQIDRIFERFYRVDHSRSRAFGGTGLGLSIVKHIVEAHEQSITVNSTPGEGSTFSFTLNKAN